MKQLHLLAALTAIALSACSRDHLSSSVRTISTAPAARKAPMILAPSRENYFTQIAKEHNEWLVTALNTAIQRELTNGGRFTPAPTGAADAEIAFETLRHGLMEVAADSYAVQVSGNAVIMKGAKQITSRDFSSVSGVIRPLKEFEDTKNYEEALQGVVDKIALELVTTL